jgi:tetratricopeptide (TPR) repeat protein
MATVYRAQGRYTPAEQLLITAVSRVEERATAEDSIAAYNELGVLFKYSGKFEAAVDFYKRALDRLSGTTSPELATLYHNIAGLAHARRDYAAAEDPARKAVAVRTEALGADHPDVAAEPPWPRSSSRSVKRRKPSPCSAKLCRSSRRPTARTITR